MSIMKSFFLIALIIITVLIFRTWLGFSLLSGGDWHYLYAQTLSHWRLGVWAWDFSFGNGFGSNDVFILPLNTYFLGSSKILLYFLSWSIVERIIFFFPYLIFCFISSYVFVNTFQKKLPLVLIITMLVFSANTYALMIVGGGQMGVALAYSLSLLVFAFFAKAIMQEKAIVFSPNVFLTGILLALQIALDVRIVYVTLVGVLIFFLFFARMGFVRELILRLTVIFILAILLNAFWLLPLAIVHQNPLQQMGAIYVTKGAVEFFSFAKFENTLGFLHPNWPDNMFGKVSFMKPEFLLLPILAYSSLLLIKKKSEEKEKIMVILFFAFIGLLGAFLAKGANEPFGGIYLWLFDNVPGFFMFRDPTKWYQLIVLSYTILIPYTVGEIYLLLEGKR